LIIAKAEFGGIEKLSRFTNLLDVHRKELVRMANNKERATFKSLTTLPLLVSFAKFEFVGAMVVQFAWGLLVQVVSDDILAGHNTKLLVENHIF